MAKFIAMDQYGQHWPIKEHPRKELLAIFGRRHAAKMYVDRKGHNRPLHVGYIIAGHWVDVFGLEGNVFAKEMK